MTKYKYHSDGESELAEIARSSGVPGGVADPAAIGVRLDQFVDWWIQTLLEWPSASGVDVVMLAHNCHLVALQTLMEPGVRSPENKELIESAALTFLEGCKDLLKRGRPS